MGGYRQEAGDGEQELETQIVLGPHNVPETTIGPLHRCSLAQDSRRKVLELHFIPFLRGRRLRPGPPTQHGRMEWQQCGGQPVPFPTPGGYKQAQVEVGGQVERWSSALTFPGETLLTRTRKPRLFSGYHGSL